MKPNWNKICLYAIAVVSLLFIGQKLPEFSPHIFSSKENRLSPQYQTTGTTTFFDVGLPSNIEITPAIFPVVNPEQVEYNQMLLQRPLPEKIERTEIINDAAYPYFPKTIVEKSTIKSITFIDTGTCYDLIHTLTYPVFVTQDTLNKLIEKNSDVLRNKCATPTILETNTGSTTCNRVIQVESSCNFNSNTNILFASERVITLFVNNTLLTHVTWNLFKNEFVNKMIVFDLQQKKEVTFEDVFKQKTFDQIKTKVLEEISLRYVPYVDILVKEKAEEKLQKSSFFQIGIGKSGIIFTFNNGGVVDPTVDIYNPYLEQLEIPFTKLEEFLTPYGRSFFPLSD